MFKFIRRFLLAWKLAKNPDALKFLLDESKDRGELQQIRMAACKNAKVAVTDLIPQDRHAHRKDLDVTVFIDAEEPPTPEEIAQVLEESRIENKPKLAENVWSTPIGNRDALIKHNEKIRQQKFTQ